MTFEFILLEPQYKHYNLIQHRKEEKSEQVIVTRWFRELE